MQKHRIFKLEVDGRKLAFIPTLKKVYEIPTTKISELPEYILDKRGFNRFDNKDQSEPCFTNATFIITQSCNLRCAYCYEDNGPHIPNQTIKKHICEATIDFLIKNTTQHKISRIGVNFFGGEPTQAFELVKDTAFYARQKANEIGIKSRVSITTNGVFGSKIASWIADSMDAVSISIDGDKEIQDVHRDRSFNVAFKNAKIFFSTYPEKLSLRSTVSNYSVDRLPDIVRFIGINFPGRSVLFEPLFKIGRGKEGRLTIPDMNIFFDRFTESLPIANEYGLRIRTSALNLVSPKSRFCGVAGRNFLITPNGLVSACNRMAIGAEMAQPEFIFGHFDEKKREFVFDLKKYETLRHFTSTSVEACRDCFAQFSCRGDCLANKATLNPIGFTRIPSYRCEAIKRFLSRLFLMSIDDKKIAACL